MGIRRSSGKSTFGMKLLTVWWFFFFWIYQLFSNIFLLAFPIFFIFRSKKLKDRYTFRLASFWSKAMIWAAGGKLIVRGRENFKKDSKVLYVSNHQGNFDIPALIASIPHLVGFVAKKEMAKFPVVSTWMKAIHCIFLERKDKKGTVQIYADAGRQLVDGQALVIFPEGTRSRRRKMGRFKRGSFRLATENGIPIMPVTVNGSYRLYEANNNWISPGTIRITFHPIITPGMYAGKEIREVTKMTENIILNGL